MFITDEGAYIVVNLEHYEKALFPIIVTDGGIVICANEEQLENA